jgi:hypothetical protein
MICQEFIERLIKFDRDFRLSSLNHNYITINILLKLYYPSNHYPQLPISCHFQKSIRLTAEIKNEKKQVQRAKG